MATPPPPASEEEDQDRDAEGGDGGAEAVDNGHEQIVLDVAPFVDELSR